MLGVRRECGGWCTESDNHKLLIVVVGWFTSENTTILSSLYEDLKQRVHFLGFQKDSWDVCRWNTQTLEAFLLMVLMMQLLQSSFRRR